MATRNTWRFERPFVAATLAALTATTALVALAVRVAPPDPDARASDSPQRLVSAAPAR